MIYVSIDGYQIKDMPYPLLINAFSRKAFLDFMGGGMGCLTQTAADICDNFCLHQGKPRPTEAMITDLKMALLDGIIKSGSSGIEAAVRQVYDLIHANH